MVNRSRSVLRHRAATDKIVPRLPVSQLERSALVSALRSLPAPQCEALALRYYADLSEAQIAAVMGISPGAVKNHAARAISSLRAGLREQHE